MRERLLASGSVAFLVAHACTCMYHRLGGPADAHHDRDEAGASGQAARARGPPGRQGILAARERGARGLPPRGGRPRGAPQARGAAEGRHAVPGREVSARCGGGAPEILAMMVADSDVLIDFLEGRTPAANRIALITVVGADRGRVPLLTRTWVALR